MNGGLKIGQLAHRVGVSAKAIRFYEAKRILPPATRAPNGYRLYSDDAVQVLRFVKQATGLGLTLADIKEIIAIRQGGRPPCAHVYRLLSEKVQELDRKLKDLLEMRRTLKVSLAAWNRQTSTKAAICRHIEEATGARPQVVRRRRAVPAISGRK